MQEGAAAEELICNSALLYAKKPEGGAVMSLSEEIMYELKSMNDFQKWEVLDFVRFLRTKEEKELDALMDSIIEDNLEAFQELAK